jgi:hypothetical protein
MHTKNLLHRLPGTALNVMGPGVVWWWCGGGGVVLVWWWCGGGVVVVWWWCGGGVVVVWFILPIIIPHQPSCFVLFCVVGLVVAIMHE